MATLKLFKNGTSQAVRIPKSMEFSGDRVRAFRHGGGLLILPEEEGWEEVFGRIDELDACMIEAPEDLPQQKLSGQTTC